ncbi:hypothetical protein RN001_000690 [Aquatica leii]|uniref:Uncharacterized protein n=1 Tax=Aquatica leii TaxID=1421715 RepID=A0AAN7Q393_9COLE|nr:hypothetical protein RN001_000690 [Aquatica leii]
MTFQLQWLRRFIRRHTSPIPEIRAAQWKQRLAIGYALLAWNAFGYVIYTMYKGKSDWAQFHNLKSEEELKMTPAQQWTRTLGIQDATVYRVSGLNYTKYEIHNEFPDKEEKKIDQ